MSTQDLANITPLPKEQLEADLLFDQHVFKTISYSATGLVIGCVASIFFKYKRPAIFFSGGLGAGLSLFDFQKDLERYRNLGIQNQNRL